MAQSAEAGGLYFSDRGVKPLGRGGAWVAGANDIGATWYNPAGLADAGDSFLFDGSWLHYSAEFKRKVQVADSAGTLRTYEYPEVNGSTPILPIPTLGISKAFGKEKQYTFAFSLLAPYTAISSYPATIDGRPAASRYSLISMDGSALVLAGGFFAWKANNWLKLGAGLQALAGSFRSTTVFNANPADRLIGAPEDPTYDTTAEINASPIFAPSGSLGVTIEPNENWRFGGAFQLPFWISAPATNRFRLPNAALFDRATHEGDEVSVSFKLPAIMRFGVEYRKDLEKNKRFKAEVSYVHEFWSMHDAINIDPKNIKLIGVTGFPSPFSVPPLSIPRNFQDSHSFRLGGEYMFPVGQYRLEVRAGVSFETSAIPRPYVTPLTIDANKVTGAIGGGLYIGERWRLDAVYAHIFAFNVEVSPTEAAVPKISPVSGNPTRFEPINAGSYSARADVIGLGLNFLY
ncbi:MAG: outer membrane protein transport protein [Polyangiaceae bacterium]